MGTDEITRYVIARYIASGDGSDAQQIANGIGVSASRVRAAFNRASGALPGLRAVRESRTSYSRDFPGMEAGCHLVWVYYPTMDRMRAAVRHMLGVLADAASWCSTGAICGTDPEEEWAAEARELLEQYGHGDRHAEDAKA